MKRKISERSLRPILHLGACPQAYAAYETSSEAQVKGMQRRTRLRIEKFSKT